MNRRLALAALVALAAVSGSCDKGPTDPSDNVVETFTGTIPFVSGTPGGAVHTINISNNGELFLTLISLTPPLPTAKYAALWLGQHSAGNCVWNGPRNNFAVPGSVISTSVQEGSACVGLFDTGDFTVDEAYEIRISHP
jgi:hypothetical protein